MNDHKATTFIFLIIPSPPQAQLSNPLLSLIDWTADPYVGKRAAVGKNKESKPEGIDVDIGLTLQLDRQEILYANPLMEGVCMIMFGHHYETIMK